MSKNEHDKFIQLFHLNGMETATPAESARTEDPRLSIAREAAEVVPAESVRRNEIYILNYRQHERTFPIMERSFYYYCKASTPSVILYTLSQ